jgi:hypothetical protein
MKITTQHPASKFGRPVVLDDDGSLFNVFADPENKKS